MMRPSDVNVRSLIVAAAIVVFLFGVPVLAQQALPEPVGRWAPGPTSAIASRDSVVYYGNGAYLVALDVANESSPRELSRVLLSGIVNDIVLVPTYAYVIDDLGALYTVDITDPAGVRLVDQRQLSVPGTVLYLDMPHLYIGTQSGTLDVYDITSPARPENIGRAAMPGSISTIGKLDTFLYVGTLGAGLQIVDVSSPADPVWMSRYVPDPNNVNVPVGLSVDYVQEVAVRPPHIYVAADREGVLQLDVSNRTRPRLNAVYATCPRVEECDIATGVTLRDDMAIVTGLRTDLRIFRLGNAATGPVFALLDTVNWGTVLQNTVNISALVPIGNRIFTTTFFWPGLRILDISNPLNVQEVLSLDTGGHYSVALAYDHPHLFVAGSWAGLRVLDVGDPSNPREISAYRSHGPDDTHEGASDVALTENEAIVAGDGLYVVNRANPDSLWEEGYVPDPSSGGPDLPNGLLVSGSLAYLSIERSGIRIYDIGHASSPSLVSAFSGDCRAFVLSHPDLYNISTHGITAWNVSVPREPRLLNMWWSTDAINLSALYDSGLLYLVTRNGLRVLEDLTPDGFREKSFLALEPIETLGGKVNLRLVDGVLLIAAGNEGLILIDVSDPDHPSEIVAYETAYSVEDVLVTDEYLFLANGDDGVHIYDRSFVPTSSYSSDIAEEDLLDVYPNPSHVAATIRYQIKTPGHVVVEVYDILGRRIAFVTDGMRSSGDHRVEWRHENVPAGLYQIRLTKEAASVARSIVVSY